jgi:small-conductance mechanosensitive channel
VHVGDIIQVDGQVGRVENIKLRTTRAVNRDNKVLIIPNHKFLTSILYNWTENGSLTRESIILGVAYNTDLDLAKNCMIAAAAGHKKVLKTPEPFVLLNEFGDSAIELNLLFSMNRSFESNLVKSDIRFDIIKRFRETGIEIPFPQRVVTLNK